MTTLTIWKGSLAMKIMMIVLSFTVLTFDNTAVFIGLGVLILLGGCFFAFRQGQGIGHECCSISHSLERMEKGEETNRQIDPKMYKQAFSFDHGLKAMFASALAPFVINCIYIVMYLLKAPSVPLIVSRLASFVVTLPFWPILNHWHETYTALTPDMVLLLMVSPFVIPGVQFLGYLQGPKLWAKTEKAMADGKRRAKARSRIVKKNKIPRSQRPEI